LTGMTDPSYCADAMNVRTVCEPRGWRARALALLVVVLPTPAGAQLEGASGGGLGDTEVVRAERGVINPQGTPTYPLEQPLNPDTYICGRGDVFELNFWGAQNFRLRVTVDIEGRTFISKVGYVDLVGKTLSEARRIVKRAVGRFYPGLNFDLSLAAPRTFLVHIVGYVQHPGIFVSNPIERAGSLLARAGTTSGSRRRIEIRRRTGDRLTVDLVLYEFTGDTKYDPFLMDGDVISVPFPELMASVAGPVRRPGTYELIDTKDLAELLELSGGFTTSLTKTLPMRLVRRDVKERDVEIKVRFPANGNPNLPMRDGDHIYISSTSELQRTVLLIGPVAGAKSADETTSVRRLPYFVGATVRSLIEGAGEVGASADLANSYIRKENGSIIPVDLEALLVRRDFTADHPVEVGDTIVVPQKRHSIVVEGAALRPGVYPFNPRFTAQDYVGISGGPNKNAQPPGTYRVISPSGSVANWSPDLKLEPGDTVLIPERSFSRAEVVGLVLSGAGLLLTSVSVLFFALRY
jgi:polysaccharide export outer membrane protein